MIKLINLDKIFDKYIERYVLDNVGKVKPEEIENKIPVLYEEFGNSTQKELDDKTPNEFYRQFTPDELLCALKEHIEKDVPVSDFLIEAITANSDSVKPVKAALMQEEDEQFTAYLMNILNDLKADIVDMRDEIEIREAEKRFKKLRYDILNFANQIASAQQISAEMIDQIFDECGEYEKLSESYGFKNDRVNVSMSVIKSRYEELLKEGRITK